MAVIRLAAVIFALCGLFARGAPAVHAAGSATIWRSFWVERLSGWDHVACRLMASGAHIKVYASPSAQVGNAGAVAIVRAFERRIYPTDTRLFGHPPGLDPINVVLVPLDSVTLGYFDQNDINPHTPLGDPLHSNHANVLYIRPPAFMPDRNRLGDVNEVVAHELQHLIEYRLRVLTEHVAPEPDWLNEGLSFYAQMANGYWTERDVLKVDAALRSPSWPVTALQNGMVFLRHNARLAYGRAGLFVSYVAARFGPAFVHSVLQQGDAGLPGLDAAIRAVDRSGDLASVFEDWGVAESLGANAGPYGYGALGRHLGVPPVSLQTPITAFPYESASSAAPLQPWGQAFFAFSAHTARTLAVQASGLSAGLRVAGIAIDSAHPAGTQVRWLTAGTNGTITWTLPGFGKSYDRAILSVSAAGGVPIAPRVTARLLNMGDHNRVTRAAPPAGHNSVPAIRAFPQVDQSIAAGIFNPESAGVAAGDAERTREAGNRGAVTQPGFHPSSPSRPRVVSYTFRNIRARLAL